MSEIYWITRLDLICDWCIGFAVVSGICAFTFAICYLCCKSDQENGHSGFEYWVKFHNKSFKIAITSFLLFVSASIMTPTTKEAMLIFGIGGSIDYLKSNDVAKQLPDKCINAIDAWVSSLTTEKKNE